MKEFRLLHLLGCLLIGALLACRGDDHEETSPKGIEPVAQSAANPEKKPTEEARMEQPLGPGLQRSIPLAVAARSILQEPMRKHADDMGTLLWSAVMLDYQAVETTAAHVAGEPRVSRPMDMTQGVFAETFPDDYIALEDQLYQAARALADAGAAKDAKSMSSAYRDMTGTCIGCHAIYLAMPGSP